MTKQHILCSCLICKKEITVQNLNQHINSKHIVKSNCLYCSTNLFTKNKFCNKSCAAKFNNKNKSKETIDKQRNSLIITLSKKPKSIKPKSIKTKKSNYIKLNKPKSIKPEYVGEYTKIYLCKCKYSGKLWYSTTSKTIHPSITDTIKQYRYQSRFNFSIRLFPMWFEQSSKLINQYGWYSASNRGNNLSGCSRDHLLSVSDGFHLGIPTNMLSHPANCEIIPHRLNQLKNSKSSITYDMLIERIKQFDELYPDATFDHLANPA